MRKALVSSTDDVVNVIEIEEGANWSPPPDHTVVDIVEENVSPGDRYVDGVFIPAEPPPPEARAKSRIELLEERLAALEARLPPE